MLGHALSDRDDVLTHVSGASGSAIRPLNTIFRVVSGSSIFYSTNPSGRHGGNAAFPLSSASHSALIRF